MEWNETDAVQIKLNCQSIARSRLGSSSHSPAQTEQHSACDPQPREIWTRDCTFCEVREVCSRQHGLLLPLLIADRDCLLHSRHCGLDIRLVETKLLGIASQFFSVADDVVWEGTRHFYQHIENFLGHCSHLTTCYDPKVHKAWRNNLEERKCAEFFTVQKNSQAADTPFQTSTSLASTWLFRSRVHGTCFCPPWKRQNRFSNRRTLEDWRGIESLAVLPWKLWQSRQELTTALHARAASGSWPRCSGCWGRGSAPSSSLGSPSPGPSRTGCNETKLFLIWKQECFEPKRTKYTTKLARELRRRISTFSFNGPTLPLRAKGNGYSVCFLYLVTGIWTYFKSMRTCVNACEFTNRGRRISTFFCQILNITPTSKLSMHWFLDGLWYNKSTRQRFPQQAVEFFRDTTSLGGHPFEKVRIWNVRGVPNCKTPLLWRLKKHTVSWVTVERRTIHSVKQNDSLLHESSVHMPEFDWQKTFAAFPTSLQEERFQTNDPCVIIWFCQNKKEQTMPEILTKTSFCRLKWTLRRKETSVKNKPVLTTPTHFADQYNSSF